MSDISREEVEARIGASDAAHQTQAARTDCRVDVAVAQLQAELRQTKASLETQMHQLTSTLIKWMAGFSLTIVLTNIGLSTFMWNGVMNRPAPVPQPAQAPIIITVPAAGK